MTKKKCKTDLNKCIKIMKFLFLGSGSGKQEKKSIFLVEKHYFILLSTINSTMSNVIK